MGATDEWYTPPEIFDALNCRFDMDVASPGYAVTPWIPAAEFITQGSLTATWRGFLWMNAPFGGRNGLRPWLRKFADHGNGVALVPDRTSAPWWQEFIPTVDATLFVRKKIKFINARGERGRSPAQGTCLVAMGPNGIAALESAARVGLGLVLRGRFPKQEVDEVPK